MMNILIISSYHTTFLSHDITSHDSWSYHITLYQNLLLSYLPVDEEDVCSWMHYCWCCCPFSVDPDVRKLRRRDLLDMERNDGKFRSHVCNCTFQYLGPRFIIWFTRVFGLYFGPFMFYSMDKLGFSSVTAHGEWRKSPPVISQKFKLLTSRHRHHDWERKPRHNLPNAITYGCFSCQSNLDVDLGC